MNTLYQSTTGKAQQTIDKINMSYAHSFMAEALEKAKEFGQHDMSVSEYISLYCEYICHMFWYRS